MTHGYQTLTEKEKETLRLLVNGYDAKSMARHLGLSIHTVNERLRDARRKMATSSSREAARQLRAVEDSDPQLIGDKVLRDASAPPSVEQHADHTDLAPQRRRANWIIGGIVMSLALAFLAYGALSGGAQTAAQPAPTAATETAAETATVTAARQFLDLIDAGDWKASYRATDKAFQLVNTQATWAEVSQQAHAPLGAMRSRELLSADYVPAPQGYWLVKFRTAYANKADAIETLSLASEDGSWKVVGIVID
jgi:DNA-binding CsgD family transcriptional regulator